MEGRTVHMRAGDVRVGDYFVGRFSGGNAKVTSIREGAGGVVLIETEMHRPGHPSRYLPTEIVPVVTRESLALVDMESRLSSLVQDEGVCQTCGAYVTLDSSGTWTDAGGWSCLNMGEHRP